MAHTVIVRIDDDLAAWLEETAKRAGIPKSRIVRHELERARRRHDAPAFLRWAGAVSGPKDLSRRRGFSRS
jgi:hypothetical protein